MNIGECDVASDFILSQENASQTHQSVPGLPSRTILDRTYSAQRFFIFSYFFFFILGRAAD